MSSRNAVSEFKRWSNLAATMPLINTHVLECEKKIFGRILDNELSCSICLETFKKPSILYCGHIFCEKCLKDWLRQHQTCPLCRVFTNGVIQKCELLEKFITETMAVIAPMVRRRHTVNIENESPAINRNKQKDKSSQRPPWRF